MSTKNLGRLQKVDLREAWTTESSDFTPWLAQEENLKLLGETIGIELELESQEKFVAHEHRSSRRRTSTPLPSDSLGSGQR